MIENGIEALRGRDIFRWLSSRRQAGISQCTIDKNLSHLRSFITYSIQLYTSPVFTLAASQMINGGGNIFRVCLFSIIQE
ncbi:hypothetical protein [Bacillus sp. AFS031507]|uniref:hypothetical protein n=1 Tax=Bacillus sp. AFS031507 TaxID=2033496 RepID=UPI0035A13C72